RSASIARSTASSSARSSTFSDANFHTTHAYEIIGDNMSRHHRILVTVLLIFAATGCAEDADTKSGTPDMATADMSQGLTCERGVLEDDFGAAPLAGPAVDPDTGT